MGLLGGHGLQQANIVDVKILGSQPMSITGLQNIQRVRNVNGICPGWLEPSGLVKTCQEIDR